MYYLHIPHIKLVTVVTFNNLFIYMYYEIVKFDNLFNYYINVALSPLSHDYYVHIN